MMTRGLFHALAGRLLGALCAGLVCGWLPGVPAALAGTGTPYGEEFVRLGERWPDAGPAPVEEPEPVSDEDSASYQRRVSDLEQEGGPYASTLAEPLEDLARLQMRSGQLPQAQAAYQRALHVLRINEGLYSESQVPVLKELFTLYRMTGDMATLDARYDYYFRLFGNGLPPHTPARLGAALEYLRWQREALRLGLDKQDSGRLVELYNLNQSLLDSVAADPEVDFTGYRELALSQLRNLYLLEDRYEPQAETYTSSIPSGIPAEWDDQDTQRHRLEMLQRGALSRGRLLLEDVIRRTPPGETESLAGTYLELADWNQWHDRREAAFAAYGEVVKLLRAAGENGLLQQWLGQPVELPDNGAFWQPRPYGSARPVVVQAHYDVSAAGRASNIEVSVLAEEHQSIAGRVRRNLSQTRFRPRILDGEPQPELGLQRDYEVLD